jgi:serine protease
LNVASTITAVRNNGLGLVSATDNNDVTIIPIRALGCDGGYSSDSADAIVWASGGAVPGMESIAGPVDIINLSLGGFAGFLCDERAFYKEAVEFAQSQGVVVVASAGNAFIDVKDFQPASCDGVLAVGSNDIRGELSNFSNYGDEIDVTFSGENINVAVINQFIYADAAASELCEINDATPTVNNCYGKTAGTSFSSPLAAASLALIKMVKPEATESELRALISSSASFYTVDDFGRPTLRSTLMKNAGIGNAYESLIMDLDFLTIENLAAVHLFDKFETESETKYLEELAAITDIERLCSSYHLSWGNYRNAVSNVEYFIYASNSSEPSLTIDNSTLITPSTDLTDITATVGNFTRVGVLSTVEDQSGDIFEFDLSDAPKPTFCL